MNRRDLVMAVREEMGDGNSAGAVGRAVEATFEMMVRALERGEQVRISGFGTLKVKGRKGSRRRNPRTGEAVEVPEKRVVKFSPSQRLKTSLNA